VTRPFSQDRFPRETGKRLPLGFSRPPVMSVPVKRMKRFAFPEDYIWLRESSFDVEYTRGRLEERLFW
jgi:hypothetical protein